MEVHYERGQLIMNITIKGQVTEVQGTQPKVGEKAPTFSLVNLKKQITHLSDLLEKPLIISVVPDVQTRVCAIQTKRFNQEAASVAEVNFVTVSNNTREEQQDWCAAEGVDMTILHDDENKFGEAYGLFIPETGRLARSIFVVDTKGILQYEEIVPEMSQEPDYEKALAAAKALI